MWSTLVSPDRLTAPVAGLFLADVRSAEAYAKGHLPGAIRVDLDHDLAAHTDAPAQGGRHPLPSPSVFARRLGELGIGPDTQVVAYDEAKGSIAARLWWMLRALGHEKVAVLDGGLPAGASLTTDVPAIAPKPPYPATAYRWPTRTIDEVDEARRSPTQLVLDVRAPVRYRGEKEPIDPVAGHIPGAVNVFFEENLGPGGRFLQREELHAKYTELLQGRTVPSLTVHCGSGVTACHTLLALEHAGLPGASLYVGSWGEWCRNPDRPREP